MCYFHKIETFLGLLIISLACVCVCACACTHTHCPFHLEFSSK